MGLERFKFLGVTTDIDRHTFYVPPHALERGGDWCEELNSVDWYTPDDGRYFLQICPTITLHPGRVREEARELLVNLATGWNFMQGMDSQKREDHAQQLCAQMAQAPWCKSAPRPSCSRYLW